MSQCKKRHLEAEPVRRMVANVTDGDWVARRVVAATLHLSAQPWLNEAAGRVSRGTLLKRMVDLMITIPALVFVAPVLLIAALLMQLSSPGPVLLRQERIGQHGHPFIMFKLRSMIVNADDRILREMNLRELQGELDPGTSDGAFKPERDPRITPVGRWLRRFSIDELPQLLNVLRGEMSIVGPRPSLPWEVELYTAEQRRRHDCLPGMTGLWQVSGRSRLPIPQMLEIDMLYVRSRSLLLDLRILWRTPKAVLFDRSIR